MLMYGRKRSELQVDLYEIDGKRHVITRVPGPSDIWADSTPEIRFRSTIIIILLCIGILLMDTLNLQWGGIASEAQLIKGNLATESEKTGPNRQYWNEAWAFVRVEAVRRDPRVKLMDVEMEIPPERYGKKYGYPAYLKNDYIGNGRYSWCFYYLIQGQGQTEFVYGTAIVRLDQQKQLGVFVQQEWIVDDYRITHSEIRKK